MIEVVPKHKYSKMSHTAQLAEDRQMKARSDGYLYHGADLFTLYQYS